MSFCQCLCNARLLLIYISIYETDLKKKKKNLLRCCKCRTRNPTWVCLMSSLWPSWQRVSTAAQITSRDNVKVFNQDIRSSGQRETGIMTDSSCVFSHHTIPPSLTNYPVLCVFIQMCSDVSHHTQDVTAGRHSYVLWTKNKNTFHKDPLWATELRVHFVNKYWASLWPDHVVPGVQDLAVGQRGGRGDDLGEQQPGPGSVLCLSVWHQVGDECRCKLVLVGPDGEGPAEISSGDPR